MKRKGKDIWQQLGFSDDEQSHLRMKSLVWKEIIKRVQERELEQKDLVKFWGTSQPNVSKIMNGRIHDSSIELLVGYLEALGLENMEIKFKYAKTQ